MSPVNGEQPVVVAIGECRCSGTPRPHPDGDTVNLRPYPDLVMGLAATSALRQSGNYVGDTEAALYSVFVRYGVVGWNIVDEAGVPVPVSHAAILDRLGWASGGAIVAGRAAELYRDTVLAPLLERRPPLPQPTDGPGSTSPIPPSGRTSRNSRQRSSRSPAAVGT